MELSAHEEMELRQALESLCDEVDIDMNNGAIHLEAPGGRIEVSPNRYGEPELRTDCLLVNNSSEAYKISKIFDRLSEYLTRHQFCASNEQKLKIRLKDANLGAGDIIQLYADNDTPLNHYQVNKTIKANGSQELTMTCMDAGITFSTSTKVDDLIDALVDYVKAHHALVPADFDHKYSSMSDYLKQNMEDY